MEGLHNLQVKEIILLINSFIHYLINQRSLYFALKVTKVEAGHYKIKIPLTLVLEYSWMSNLLEIIH